MPRSLLILCLTNLFSWMSLVCYSLFFTDFVGQAVYGGDPKAPSGSLKHQLYDEGVRVGSFGMSLYSLACGIYSIFIEKLVEMFSKFLILISYYLLYVFNVISVDINIDCFLISSFILSNSASKTWLLSISSSFSKIRGRPWNSDLFSADSDFSYGMRVPTKYK
jgi:hypothetical protein